MKKIEEHLSKVAEEVSAAAKKHPEFASGGFLAHPADRHDEVVVALDEELLHRRELSDARNDVYSILAEEVLEGVQATLKGDYKNAYAEFAQVAAVAVRAMMKCEKEGGVEIRQPFRMWSQKDIDAVKPDEDGVRRFGRGIRFLGWCEFGDKCEFDARCEFGPDCKFGEGGTFGDCCVFDTRCTFGRNSVFGDGCEFGERCLLSFGTKLGEDCKFCEGCTVKNEQVAAAIAKAEGGAK